MKKLFRTLAAASLGLALTAVSANAAPIVFTVHEDPTLIPGVVDNTFDADNITGKYLENLDLDPLGPGTFSADLLVEFASYADGGTLQNSQLETFGAAGYSLYALVTVSGEYTSAPDPNAPGETLFTFDPQASTAEIYIDPDQTMGGDILIMTASTINQALSTGTVRVLDATGQVLEGSYALVYTNAQTNSNGDIYWPDFEGFTLIATASGDVDPPSNINTGEITGDTSLSFERQQAPEPASMTLFGLALFGAGIVARRRRAE